MRSPLTGKFWALYAINKPPSPPFRVMSSPLEAFLAAERFINAAVKLDPRAKAAMSQEQTAHVVQLLESMSFNKDDGTLLLCELARTPSIFSVEQRQTIATSVRATLDNPCDLATATTRTFAKEQTHLFIHHYLPARIWRVILSEDTVENKLRHLARWCV